jgi:hypothetical protein
MLLFCKEKMKAALKKFWSGFTFYYDLSCSVVTFKEMKSLVVMHARFIFLLAVLLLGLSSCKKKDPEPKSKFIPSNYMVAKVDGADWKAYGPLPYLILEDIIIREVY